MWVLALNGLAYIIYGIATGRFRRMLFPIRLRQLIADINDALHFHLQHDDLTVYNAVQRLLYAGIILIAIIQVVSGLFIWKPMQFSELTSLFYSFQGGRLVHFLGMAAIVGFLVVHVALALLVPKTIVNMLTGGPQIGDPRRPINRPPRSTFLPSLPADRKAPCPYARHRPRSFAPSAPSTKACSRKTRSSSTTSTVAICCAALSVSARSRMLTGCDVTDRDAVQSVLTAVSSFNDRVQALLFRPNHLVPTYSRGRGRQAAALQCLL